MTKSKKKHKKISNFQEIYGFHSVLAALNNPLRKNNTIYILKKYTNLVKKYDSKIEKINILSSNEMIKTFGNENSTQGIVLKCNKLPKKEFNEIFSRKKSDENSLVVVLDQVTDPNNIGSIMRSCALFNCKTIIVSNDHAPEITSSIIKSASGATEIVNYLKVVNINRALIELKKMGYWIYGLDSNADINEELSQISKKAVFVFGSEGKGIRDLTKKSCDIIFSIPSKKNKKFHIDSLNVSNACAITLFQYFKKFN